MSTATFDSPSDLKSGVRIRPDLIYAPRSEGDEETWVVKDPVTLRYFHFGPAEVFIMRLIDGRNSVGAIQKQYDDAFAPRRISQQEILAFCHRLYQRGLLVGSSENQAEGLLQRRKKNERMKLASLPLQVLAIRLPGIDPERFLAATKSAVGWLFQRGTIIAVLLIASIVAFLGVLNLETIVARLPDQSHLFRGENLLVLLLTFAFVKVLHELGHAYCCKAMGGECHQIGVLLLVFMPAMYCDVSDAWLFPKRWQRVTVSAAGMYVELILATIAAVLWFFAQPGMVSGWLLNVMIACGVSTLLVNANPLLRYDGYYILADWLNLPNLSSRSQAALWTPMRNWFFRQPRVMSPEPRAALLRTYALLAIVYRTFVLGLIVWFLYQTCRANDLLPLWHMILVSLAIGMMMKPGMLLFHWLKRPGRKGDAMIKRRVFAAIAFALLVAVGLASIPIPSRIHVPAIAEVDSDRRVYVQVDGRLIDAVKPDAVVQQGDILATLQNDELAEELLRIEGEIKIQRQHLESLKLLANNNPEASSQIPTAESALGDLLEQEAILKRKTNQLAIRAPADGVVLSAPHKMNDAESERLLPSWSGNPLDERNLGCYLQRGELLCLIGDRSAIEARLLVRQDQIELIRPGDTVSILFDGMATEAVSGTMKDISTDHASQVPRNLAANPTWGVERRPDGTLALADGAYSATVELDQESTSKILPGTSGRAVIVGRSQTVWQIVARFLQLNFRFSS